MRWIFIGAGNMASSLVGGLVGAGTTPDSITVVDPDGAACERASRTFGIHAETSTATVLDAMKAIRSDDGPGLVIAVKPHIVEAVCHDIAGHYRHLPATERQRHSPLVISVAAGVRCSSLQAWLPEGMPIVRCMPNTPALLGLGATALFANPACSDQQRRQAQALLDTAGLTLWVDEESQLDAVTAVSGSGPAYFFYLIEHMIEAGKALGLDADTAEQLAIETAFGAASMARQRKHAPAVLRENVTSKGGTTAAALQVFNDRNVPAIILQAMQAAHDRAAELGDQLAPD